MVLGDRFPEAYKLNWVRQRLTPWSVIYVPVHFSNPPPKEKFLVIARVHAETLAFAINSRPTEFIRRNPKLLACQVQIGCGSHTFLSYDSYIDCTDPIHLKTHEIEERILSDVRRVKGEIAQDVRQYVIDAVKRSPTMTRDLRRELLNELDPDG
jgi:hypothetical protein